MIGAERQVERGIADARTLGIQEHRAVRPDEDVLRADVTVDHHQPGRCGPLAQTEQRPAQVGMPGGGRLEVGLEADGVEDVVAGKASCDLDAAGGRRVDRREPAADLGREVRVSVPVAQLALPQLVAGRIEVGHRAEHRRVVVEQHLGRRAGHDRPGDLVPGDLEAVALDRGEPLGLDPELRQRALDAEHLPRRRHLPDVGRDPAGQRLERRLGRVIDQAGRDERGEHRPVGLRCVVGWHGHGRLGADQKHGS